MEPIFYEDAADILDISVGTLKQAIGHGFLTKAGRDGRKSLLLREQVELFVGINPRTGNKKRISFEALSDEEIARWHELVNLADNAAKSEQDIPEKRVEAISRQVSRQTAREEVSSQIEPLMIALGDVISQWNSTRPQKREVPQGVPFLMKKLQKV